ncbi:MAG: hypothetical protein U9N34_05215, partial [Candidatus Cloacimonadota bacterium]|nr:hypothetical protein [Candidatus Cloacimonadota bacterium]
MEDYLNKKQIDYIFFHLNHHFNIHDFKESIELVREQKKLDKGKIYFYLSKKKLDPKKISKVK